ncbi:glycosyltransferase family 39 protein [Kamptonema sp. UHCC 0994]|uniref:glycosyltransferase family 39 protein n=1 Tax=Kamptonema sp. UHCC 0994 TaxID=3031329 RepID=UPI0023BA21DE|nr:glycosyltransferase family 39 protein [Kamptonema sp. UHCC 0994]MDF0551907.1 glycosyltransferase family 39 protein [Kamptonema sp. UHCC 0994]
MIHHKYHLTWLQPLIIVLLILGIFFRFVNLDNKVYWYDETITSLRLAGYTKEEFTEQVSGPIIDIKTLQKYQRLNPDRGVAETVKALAVGNPEQPPLYYALAHFWVQLFGDSITVIRSFSAVISLLVFPCIYWLCWELFKLPIVGLIAVGLMAVSPFQVLYAQEARPYSLFTVMILLSSCVFLRVIRLETPSYLFQGQRIVSWGIYAVTIALGLYSQLLFILVIMGHGIYLLATEIMHLKTKNCFSLQKITGYLIATLSGIIAFIPWIVCIINNFSELGWVANKINILTLLTRLSINITSILFDVQIGTKERLFDVLSGKDNLQFGTDNLWLYTIVPTLILVGYSLKFLCKNTPEEIWLFILILILSTATPLVFKDLISGGQRSSIARYLIPCYLGIQLAVAYLLANKITSKNINQQKMWQIITIILISGAVLSCAISSQSETWWNKYSSYYNPQVAKIINQATQPLIVSSNAIRLTSLSYLLENKVKLQVVPGDNFPKIPDGFTDIFLFYPSKKFQLNLEKDENYKLDSVYPNGNLWRLSL